jgi:L-aspartate oxidase
MVEFAPQALWHRPVIVGGGVAGAIAALTLSPQPVILLDSAPPGSGGSSRWAQGGLAAAVGLDDSAQLHAQDTVAVGAGLTEPDVASRIAGAGSEIVTTLENFGVRFDRDPSGAFALGLEAAHSRRRILHVRDATGAAILGALNDRIQNTPSIARMSGVALRLIADAGKITGILIGRGNDAIILPTASVVLATGGAGGLWQSTTNPATARASGIVLAAKAGAALADLEFMQFHPTALAVGADPMPLISEAVRGEGAILIDAQGDRFMADVPGGDLAARDIVARAVFNQWAGGGSAALDVRHWPAGKFAGRFPTIHAVLAEYGLDPERDPIPVRPAAHYHMGGVRVDAAGRTTVPGLWACGEAACTGLHGANRLASNSLLEAAVCGRFAAEDVAGISQGSAMPALANSVSLKAGDAGIYAALRSIMDLNVGVVRDGARLKQGMALLQELHRNAAGTMAQDDIAAAMLIARAAECRSESRGAHFRSDATAPSPSPAHSISYWSELDEIVK